MLTGTITQTDGGSFQVHCSHGQDATIIPLDLDQWEMVKRQGLVGKQVYIKEVMKGGGFVAQVILTHSDSKNMISIEEAEEMARQAFYDGREVSRMERGNPIFKHQTFNGWLRERNTKSQSDQSGS